MPPFFTDSIHPALLALALLWSLPWKGVALWRAAKNEHKGWFIALLIISSLAILDIIYIVFFSKRKTSVVLPQPPQP